MAISFSGCHGKPPVEQRYKQARTQFEQGRLEEALASAEEGYRETEKDNSEWTWRFRLLRAEVLVRQKKRSEALNVLEPIPPSRFPLDVVVRHPILRAVAECGMEMIPTAKERLDHAQDQIPKEERGLQAELALARGQCAVADHQIDIAEGYFRNAQSLAVPSNPFIEAHATGSLGYLFMGANRYDEAIEQFLKAIPMAKALHSLQFEELARGNLGFCYSQLGDWRRAISFSREAKNQAALIKKDDDVEAWLVDLGKAHYALWEMKEAEDDYKQAFGLAVQLKDADQTARCLHNLVGVALRKKDVEAAEDFQRQEESLARVNDERKLERQMDRAAIMLAQQQWREAGAALREVMPKVGVVKAEVSRVVTLSLVQRMLGEAYAHERKIAQADEMFREGIATAEAYLNRITIPERRMSFLDQLPFYDSYIRFLGEQGRPRDALKIAERSRAETLPSRKAPPNLSIEALQVILKRERQVLLAYWVTDDQTSLWVITPAVVKHFPVPGHRDLHLEFKAFDDELRDRHDVEDSPAAQHLYKTLIGPAENLIPPGHHVVIVPSKVLSWVSFEALVVPGPHPHYWLEDVDVQITGSLAGLSKSTPLVRPVKTKKELLLIGDPVEVSKEFPALKNASEERKRVLSHFLPGQPTPISGSEATPHAYIAAQPGDYRLIHLDTHATASDLSPLDSAIILSPDASGSYKLLARQIQGIPLHADLVTISACYGAGTRWYNNAGVVGLGWAFLRAGAHQVIAGLWEVDDSSSPQLMDVFYGQLAEGKSAAEALHTAKLGMLRSQEVYRHPYYWASLQLYTGS